jgi:hypothetical protein
MHLAMKKDTKKFHYTSNSCGFFFGWAQKRLSIDALRKRERTNTAQTPPPKK